MQKQIFLSYKCKNLFWLKKMFDGTSWQRQTEQQNLMIMYFRLYFGKF